MQRPPDHRTMPLLVRWFSATLAVTLGAGYAFGPAALGDAAAFIFARQLLPIRMWGVLFIVCGISLILPRLSIIAGHVLCAVIWTIWAIFLFLASIDSGLQSWGAFVWPLYFAALNYMHVWLWGRAQGRRLREQRG
jgi:hypothetical protein